MQSNGNDGSALLIFVESMKLMVLDEQLVRLYDCPIEFGDIGVVNLMEL